MFYYEYMTKKLIKDWYKYSWVDVIWKGTFPFGDYANQQPMEIINWNYDDAAEAMGKTFGGLFPGLKQNQQSTGGTTAATPNTTTATATETPTTDKE